MKARIQKWGNSLALRIPKSFANDLGLHSESEVELSVVNGQLVIAPVAAQKHKYELEDLLAQINEDNLHKEFGDDFSAPL